MQMSGEETSQLKRQRSGIQNEREQQHAIRNQLSRNGEEEKVCLGAALILGGRVAKSQNQALKKEGRSKEIVRNELVWVTKR